MSQGRLFELLCLLLEPGRMTAGELAEHFEVSVRTIYRCGVEREVPLIGHVHLLY